jgi:hypothetical protein
LQEKPQHISHPISKSFGYRNRSTKREKRSIIIRLYGLFLILRKIFGPVQDEDGSWRIRMNYELNEIIENADRLRFIKK